MFTFKEKSSNPFFAFFILFKGPSSRMRVSGMVFLVNIYIYIYIVVVLGVFFLPFCGIWVMEFQCVYIKERAGGPPADDENHSFFIIYFNLSPVS